jgi:polar amino acid transport system substrate-binding protein
MRLVSYDRTAPIKTIAEAKNLTIGIIRGHAAIPTLKELGFTKIDDSAVNAELNATKLLNKRFDAIVDAKLVYLYNWKKIGQNTKDLQEGPMIGDIAHIYIASDLDFPDDLAKSIADAIEKMRKDGTIQKILDKWK